MTNRIVKESSYDIAPSRNLRYILDTDEVRVSAILITATALHHDLTLISGNRSHFERIPDLKLYSAQAAG